jgi:hypothetical protein
MRRPWFVGIALVVATGVVEAQPKPKALRRALAVKTPRVAPAPRLAAPELVLDLDSVARIEAITYDTPEARLGKRTKPPGIALTKRLGVRMKKKSVLFGFRF